MAMGVGGQGGVEAGLPLGCVTTLTMLKIEMYLILYSQNTVLV